MKTVLILCLALFLVGCAPALSSLEQKSLQTMRDQMATQHQQDILAIQAVKAEADKNLQIIKDANLVNDENGKNAPAFHPLDANQTTIKELHPWALGACILFSALWAAEFILNFTAFKFLAPFGSAFRSLALLALAALYILPFSGWIFYVIAIGIIALFVEQMIRNKGNVGESINDVKTDLGIESDGSVTTATAVTTTPTTTKVVTASIDKGGS